MEKKKAHLLVFDGLADWETPLAMCEIAKSGKFEVQSVGFSTNIVTTMGGLKIVPDVTIEDVKPSETAIFLMPGGDEWEQQSFPEITKLLQTLHNENVPVAAICGATLQIARAGLTKGVRHTSNDKEYLKAMIPEYADDDFYVNELAVTDKNIITANGVGSVEFGREVIKILGIYDEKMTEAWFNLFKHAVWDESMRD